MRRRARVWLALACVPGLLAATDAANAATAASIPDSTPAWATAANRVGDAPATDNVAFRVYLAPRDPAGAAATARAVADPTSPSYGRYLSPAQVRARYAPSAAAVDAVKAWLGQSGFAVGSVPANNLYVAASGSVGQVEAAFGADLSVYAIRGRRLRAADADLKIPASLAGTVAGVIGVDQALGLLRPANAAVDRVPAAPAPAPLAARPGIAPPPDGFRNAPPCSTYWAQLTTTLPPFGAYPPTLPDVPCGYTPTQLRQVYGLQGLVAAGLTGAGTTVAIVDAYASPTLLADAQQYARNHDPGHPLAAAQFSQRIFPETPGTEDVCDAPGWYGEQSLDVEAVHAMAPGAKIVYVGGADCVALDEALNAVVADHLAQIVSNSYGEIGEDVPADEIQAFQQIAVQAALEGIGVYFSSGDGGDEADELGVPETDFPASSPWVTAVGGTSLGIGAAGQRVLETGWETTKSTLTDGTWSPPAPGAFLYGSGGGTSRVFAQPFYQVGVVPRALAAQNQSGRRLGRVVPDLAADGDPNTGFLIGLTQSFPEGVAYDEYRIGGTSLSSPLIAGIMALADNATHFHHGFINPALYRGRGRARAGLTDVKHVTGAVVRTDYVNGVDAADGTVTSIRTLDDQATTIRTTPGYDTVTGLGTPNGLRFLLGI